MPQFDRRSAFRLAFGSAAAALVPDALSATPPPLPGLPGLSDIPKPDVSGGIGDVPCVRFVYKGRKIGLCLDKSIQHGTLHKAVQIDGQPLPVMVHMGKYISPLNPFVEHDSLQSLAGAVVDQLKGRHLKPLKPPKAVPPGLQVPHRSRRPKRLAVPVRRNVADLSAEERSALVRALLEVKANGSYDYLVDVHRRTSTDMSWGAHMTSGFLPWHRAYLLLLEHNLREAGATALPYWDWTTHRRVGVAPFTDDLLGGDGYAGDDAGQSGRPERTEVTTGAFAHARGDWPITIGFTEEGYLRRELGKEAGEPSGADDLATVMGHRTFDQEPFDRSVTSFRNSLEGWWPSGSRMHNRTHLWVGGDMVPLSSPNDPVFFLHHAYIDKLWADWQARYPEAPHYAGKPGIDTPLEPFNAELDWAITPRALLRYQDRYEYESPA